MASTSPDKWDEKSEPATPEIQEMVDKIKATAIGKADDTDQVFEMFQATAYCVKSVPGRVTYLIKVNCGGDSFMHVTVHQAAGLAPEFQKECDPVLEKVVWPCTDDQPLQQTNSNR